MASNFILIHRVYAAAASSPANLCEANLAASFVVESFRHNRESFYNSFYVSSTLFDDQNNFLFSIKFAFSPIAFVSVSYTQFSRWFFFCRFSGGFCLSHSLWLRLKSLWLIKFTSFVMRCKTIWKYLCTWSRWASVCCTSSKKSKYFCCSFRHFSCLWDHSTTRHVLHFFFFWFAIRVCDV